MLYIYDEINDFSEDDYQKGYGLLNSQRRKKADAYKFFKDKRLSMLVFLLLRYAAKAEYGITDYGCAGTGEQWDMEYGVHGKPYLKHYPDIFFNLSHCGSAAACVLSDEPVGVDVQDIVTDNQAVMRRVMSADEIKQIVSAQDNGELFTKYWSLKESYLKYRGTGLTESMVDLDFSKGLGEKFKLYDCSFLTKQINNYYLSVCSRTPIQIYTVTKDELIEEKGFFPWILPEKNEFIKNRQEGVSWMK